MELRHHKSNKQDWGRRVLQWINLRPEESQRTFLMFAFYTCTSIGLLWLEASATGLFLENFGASNLPGIYIASSGITVGLGFLYSWMQRVLPLRRVVVLIALLMALPLLLFRYGLDLPTVAQIGGLAALKITVLGMRLWLEAIYVLNDLNASITANQLFNIREIKRTYPLISSGILVADVVSGFSLPLLLGPPFELGLSRVILLAFIMMLLGAAILFYLSQTYQQAFPDSLRRRSEEGQADLTVRRSRGQLQNYIMLLFAFFILAQVLFLLVDFQFLSQLEQQPGFKDQGDRIASFLGLFNGVLGIFELAMQWLFSSRVIERIGVFAAILLLPVVIVILGSLTMTGLVPIFLGLVSLKFFYELLHYTLFAGVGPVLFQPVPDNIRGSVQADVRGIAEPLSTGATGVGLLWLVWLTNRGVEGSHWETWILATIILLALVWFISVWFLRAQYVTLLVLSAGRGQLSGSDVDLRELKRAVVEALDKPGTEADKRSCIELLSQIDPKNVSEVLAPLLPKLSPALQRQSLEEMLMYPNPAYLPQVKALIDQPPPPEVLAVALRYVWISDSEPDMRQLRPYLRPEVDAVVRGTAASLMLRLGNSTQKAEATNTLRLMLTHKRERERVMGCRALGEAVYLQALRLYIPDLLQDESLRVRCALLEAIAATHLEEYYPSLLRGLFYKSTREAAKQALQRLDNEAIPMLVKLAEDDHKPDLIRFHAWSVIGQIGTIEALDILVSHLQTSWGANRRNILRILLKIPQEKGIEGVLDRLRRSGVEQLIDQELMFIGQVCAALVDLDKERGVWGREAELLQRALSDLQADGVERLFLLMKFLYPLGSIQAAAFNLQSHSRSSMARGLEILDNTLDIPSKRALLVVLDRNSEQDKLRSLSDLVSYAPMTPSNRLRRLLDLRHFLSDWPLACCFHLARQMRWGLTAEHTLACMRHPTGFVREAVLSYLQVASPRALRELLPMLESDPDRLVRAQVERLLKDFGKPQAEPDRPNDSQGSINFSNTAGLEPL